MNAVYKMIFDYHTHTTYSHGLGSIEDNVKVAISKGLEAIAISDHGQDHKFFGIKPGIICKMREEVDRVNEMFPEIQVYLSVEANIYNQRGDENRYIDVYDDDLKNLDFVIAGYHYGVQKCQSVQNYVHNRIVKIGEDRLCEKNTEMVVNALANNKIKILTHPCDKGPFDIEVLAHACAKYGVWMEISTHHKNLTVDEIKIAMREDVSFVVSSDAHTPERVGDFQGGVDRALEAGLPIERIVNIQRI